VNNWVGIVDEIIKQLAERDAVIAKQDLLVKQLMQQIKVSGKFDGIDS